MVAQGDNFKDKFRAGDGQEKEKEGGGGVEDLCKGINVEEGGNRSSFFLGGVCQVTWKGRPSFFFSLYFL